MSTTYRARIIRADDSGLWVSVPALGDAEFGPLESIISDILIKPKYTVGDRVIIEQIGSIPEDFIVVGIATRTIGTPPDWIKRNIDASQVVSGVLATARVPNLDASKITSGTFPVARLPHVGADSTGVAWLTSNPSGGWAGTGSTHSMIALSPTTDTARSDKFMVVVDGSRKFAVDGDGRVTVGIIPAERVDKIASSQNLTYILGRAGAYGVGSNNTALLLDAGNGNTGVVRDGSFVWRWNSAGTLMDGSVPAERITGVLDAARVPAQSWASITGKPATFVPSSHTHTAAEVTSGTLDVQRIPHLGNAAGTTGRAYFTTSLDGSLGASNTYIGISPPADSPNGSLMWIVLGGETKWGIDKNGALAAGTIPFSRIEDATVLASSGTNLNNYATTGLWHQPLTRGATEGTNYPVGIAGLLEVFESAGFVYQRYTTYSNFDQTYTRGRYENTWSAWKEVSKQATAAGVVSISAAANSVRSAAIAFPSGRFRSGSDIAVATSVHSAVPHNRAVGVSAPSASGVTINIWANESISVNVSWIAQEVG